MYVCSRYSNLKSLILLSTMMKRIFTQENKKRAIILLCMLLSFCQFTSADNKYGLKDNIQDGVILHCFDWTYKDIIAELPNIAAAGFTAVQTSPAQPGAGSGIWWWLYQPLEFKIGTNELGSKQDLENLCTEAHKYGVKIVVDVVANHMAGSHENIDSELKPSEYWHNYGGNINYSDRYSVTHGDIGMADLNSENTFVQNKVAGYVSELKSAGVDGIRWDAAKHIGLPSESCQFWPVVTKAGLWNYGEILVGPIDNGGDALMKEYTNYISVTDSPFGSNNLDAFSKGNVPQYGSNWSSRGIADNKLVYWGESHDTYANDNGSSKGVSQNVIDRAYALAASHNGSTALYFSRPFETVKNNIKIGVKGSTHFTSKEVAAVNHFHNALAGEADYYATSNGVASSCRKDGAIIVKGSGSGSVTATNGGGYTQPGTYTDEVSGNTFTVTSTTISGNVGESGIAVFYNGTHVDNTSVIVDKKTGTYYKSVTVNIKPSKDGAIVVYTTDGTAPTAQSKQITSATDLTFTSNTTLNVAILGSDGTLSSNASYTYAISQTDGIKIYVKSNDTDVYLYAWKSATEILNGEWPGTLMTEKTTINGVEWRVATIAAESFNIILDNGSGKSQTKDIVGIQKDTYLEYSGSTYTDVTSKFTKTTLPACCTYVNGKLFAYFEAPATWGKTINVWAWNDKTNFTQAGKWPGDALTKVGSATNGNAIWQWIGGELTSNIPTEIIFNDGTSQTIDLAFTNGGYYDLNGLITTIPTTTGITSTNDHPSVGNNIHTATIYTIDGRLIRQGQTSNAQIPLNKGIYIINHKKYAVR